VIPKSIPALIFIALVFLNNCVGAEPQKNKLTGDAYFFHSGEVYDAHAYKHAKILHEYASGGQFVPPDVIDEQTAAIRYNVDAANKAYAKLSAAAKKNPTTAKQLAEIQKFHSGILKLCDELDTETHATAIKIKDALASAYAASRQAASSQNILTEELDKPGHGAFSD
jgi:hypothetical protein